MGAKLVKVWLFLGSFSEYINFVFGKESSLL